MRRVAIATSSVEQSEIRGMHDKKNCYRREKWYGRRVECKRTSTSRGMQSEVAAVNASRIKEVRYTAAKCNKKAGFKEKTYCCGETGKKATSLCR